MIPFKPTDFEPRRPARVDWSDEPSWLDRELDRPVMRWLHIIFWVVIAVVARVLLWFWGTR